MKTLSIKEKSYLDNYWNEISNNLKDDEDSRAERNGLILGYIENNFSKKRGALALSYINESKNINLPIDALSTYSM